MFEFIEFMVKGILRGLVELIFYMFLNFIGTITRWLFFLGRHSYKKLSNQTENNIIVAILVLIMIIGTGIYLNENSKKDIQEQEISSILSKTYLK